MDSSGSSRQGTSKEHMEENIGEGGKADDDMHRNRVGSISHGVTGYHQWPAFMAKSNRTEEVQLYTAK